MEPKDKKIKKRNETNDLTEGNLFKKVIQFALPLILTGVLQLFFNAADVVVVGNFATPTALSAVGSTTALINLIVNMLLGLSVGAGVVVANAFGSKDDKSMEETVHTAMLSAVIGGFILLAIGQIFSERILVLMGTPSDVIDQASLYVRIYFIGIPFTAVYNFGAAILRAVGDTKRPLYFLIISGIINVVFNLFFVIVFKMDVAGVATATVISQVISSVLVVIYLTRVNSSHKLVFKNLRIVGKTFRRILFIGFPAGLQGSIFSISNILIQSGINSFGSVAMAGVAASANIEGFIYTAMNAFHHTTINFVGQHIGAKKVERIKNIAWVCLIYVTSVGLIFGLMNYLLGRFLLSLYVSGEESYVNEVIKYGLIGLKSKGLFLFICGIMEVMSGLLRGMGKSLSAMIMTLTCVCGIRVLWLYTVFAVRKELAVLFLSYPVSWLVCIIGETIAFLVIYKRLLKTSDKIE